MNVQNKKNVPMILAPAGNRDSFLAAIAAKADAVYCGLKRYSARMETKNFTAAELEKLTRLAKGRGVKVYLALNSLLKADELDTFAAELKQVSAYIRPDALIVQDLAVVRLARQLGFAGEIHLSTLANVSFPAALKMIRKNLQVDRVVLPRELSIDEIKTMAGQCPEDLTLEVFVHGALCYGISGRCYWSSYLGGKSGLRGQCVQPCRRYYSQGNRNQKYFSCQDLSLDVLVKTLLDIPNISAWKIEGRKKSPHYVYYTTTAYRMLRDEGKDTKIKKSAVGLLERALGRSGTHYFFLPQRPYSPIDPKQQTGSGLFVGNISIGQHKTVLIPREELLPGDVLRAGFEDETGYGVFRVNRYVPKKGRYFLSIRGNPKQAKGVPVFLTDRREKALEEKISQLDRELDAIQPVDLKKGKLKVNLSRSFKGNIPLTDMTLFRKQPKTRPGENVGIWLSVTEALPDFKTDPKNTWWWLPPVVWPDEEKAVQSQIQDVIGRGGKKFVLNAPWQKAFFHGTNKLILWAGPFCNIGNPAAVDALKTLGFSGVIISPELSKDNYLTLPGQSVLPLGIVLWGHWPLCISRVFPQELVMDIPFTSPKKEQAWTVRYDNCLWIYPNWKLDIRSHRKELMKAGYRLFAGLSEPLPKTVTLKKRPGKWNWDLTLH